MNAIIRCDRIHEIKTYSAINEIDFTFFEKNVDRLNMIWSLFKLFLSFF